MAALKEITGGGGGSLLGFNINAKRPIRGLAVPGVALAFYVALFAIFVAIGLGPVRNTITGLLSGIPMIGGLFAGAATGGFELTAAVD